MCDFDNELLRDDLHIERAPRQQRSRGVMDNMAPSEGADTGSIPVETIKSTLTKLAIINSVQFYVRKK